MKCLGIDIGTATTGWGVVSKDKNSLICDDFGIISTHKDTNFPDRLKILFESIQQLILTYKPDTISLESIFFNTNQTTAIKVAQARGVVVLAAAQNGIKLFEYSPPQVKLAVSGNGHSDKAAVQRSVAMILKLPEVPQPDDAADALAQAITYFFSNK